MNHSQSIDDEIKSPIVWSKYQSDLSLTGDNPTLCCAQGSPKRLGWPTRNGSSHHWPGTQLSHNAAALLLGKVQVTTKIIQGLGRCNALFGLVDAKTPDLRSMKWPDIHMSIDLYIHTTFLDIYPTIYLYLNTYVYIFI